MYRDKKWAVPNAGCRRMHLEIPKDELILFDRRTWNKILNMEYVGTDEEIAAFEQEYKRQGVREPLDIMKSSFYPLLAQKIKEKLAASFLRIHFRKRLTGKALSGI